MMLNDKHLSLALFWSLVSFRDLRFHLLVLTLFALYHEVLISFALYRLIFIFLQKRQNRYEYKLLRKKMEWFHLYPFSVTLFWAKFQSDWKESQLFSDQYLFDVCILNIWLRIICGGSNRPVLKFNYFGKWGYILRFTHIYKSDTLTVLCRLY